MIAVLKLVHSQIFLKKNIFTLSTFLSSTEHTAFSFLKIFLIFLFGDE